MNTVDGAREITQADFIEWFSYLREGLKDKSEAIETWENFYEAVAKLRSDCVYYLRSLGFPGWKRAKYNNALQRYTKASHLEYLFFVDPTCKLCNLPVETFEEASEDHIIPRVWGGENKLENKQLTHAACNNDKSDGTDSKNGFNHGKNKIPEKYAAELEKT
jgi:5-methylcytosine-specific restriction endonuclease McrA